MKQLPIVAHEYCENHKFSKELIPRLWLQIICKALEKIKLHQTIVEAYVKARNGKDG